MFSPEHLDHDAVKYAERRHTRKSIDPDHVTNDAARLYHSYDARDRPNQGLGARQKFCADPFRLDRYTFSDEEGMRKPLPPPSVYNSPTSTYIGT